MICLECAAKQPDYKPLDHPTPMEKLPCTMCGQVKLCVANHTVGVQGMSPDDAFKLIAKLVGQSS